MTHNRPPVPPAEQWPLLTGPDCPRCDRPTDVEWIGSATSLDGTEVSVWHCHACPADWTIRTTLWPVLDGPDCPTCDRPGTVWAALDPDEGGDLWICPDGHEFTLTPEGLIILPGEGAA
ncbi:hypothetical protein Acsp03_27450 [Actinomadura sp. NBRC 104412]|uniref:hypothetical protein n=1 Tax=Actinomadura sp. NBRC 104412 TaxID=3032203 RepID=UPI0024A159F5|nr:hypothetical protein [Actinomadura sp. NBRC 104412]GLZ05279.1 hypothetical protein Acsp03_27450 [Actinomadura sp. NBRC 104412]